MSQYSITTSRSILMHTSLAYLSPELRTLDSILQDSSNGTLRTKPTSVRLPTEILLSIRLHLFPMITTQLFRRSTHALSRYETNLRKLLCKECLSYNQEVYGPDMWRWEHFNGACSCRAISNTPAESREEYRRALGYYDLWGQDQAFPDCSTWLESYLSFESLHLAGCHISIQSIWDVVDLALKDHGCRLSDHTAQPFGQYCSPPLRGMQITLDIPTPIVIVPECSLPSDDESVSSGLVALYRAKRDLGLSCAYERDLRIWKDAQSRERAQSIPYNSQTYTLCIQSQAVEIISTMSTVVAVAMSLPITLATVALTVVCFYSSNSRALRII